MNKKIADLEFGKEGEIRTQKLLESLFGPLEDQNETDENSLFDFKNDHVYVEVKRRRVTKAKYPDTMVGENKVIEGFNLQTAGYRVFFAFDFVDKLCLWELNRDEYEVRHGGRYDRGRPEIKWYCYIPKGVNLFVVCVFCRLSIEPTPKSAGSVDPVDPGDPFV